MKFYVCASNSLALSIFLYVEKFYMSVFVFLDANSKCRSFLEDQL
jgi:hypothetical protein